MDFEFETTRTGLANAFAAAGAELLNYMGASATQAAIPDTQPQKYAIAGTLPGILQMAGKMMGEEGKMGLEGLNRYDQSDSIGIPGMVADANGEWVAYADVERLLAARAAAEKPTGDLTDEQIQDAVQGIYLSDHQDNPEGYDIAIARAAIAAHLARQSQQAEQPIAKVIINDGNGTATVMLAPGADLKVGQSLYLATASQEGAHAARNEVRNQALEEAAAICDDRHYNWRFGDGEDSVSGPKECAALIRALKTPASAERSGDHE